jgi:hypothetical protein
MSLHVPWNVVISSEDLLTSEKELCSMKLVSCMNIVWHTCSVNTTMGTDQKCICYELVRENASDVKVFLLIFVMSWVSERTKILINKRHSQWCTCVMKNDDLSVLCIQRPWPISAVYTKTLTYQCCVYKDLDLSVLCIQRPWPISAVCTKTLTSQGLFTCNTYYYNNLWPSKEREIFVLTFQYFVYWSAIGLGSYWNRMYACSMHETHHTLDTFCWI